MRRTTPAALGLATLVCVALLAVPAPGAGRPRSIEGHGIRMTLEHGWSGRLYVRAGSDAPALQAASLPLRRGDGDLGSSTQRALRPGDVLIVLWEYVPPPHPAARWHRNFPIARLPIRLSETNGPFDGQSAPAASIRGFRSAGRYFELLVFYGSRHPAFEAANRALARLRIAPFSASRRAALLRRQTRLRVVKASGVPAGFKPFETLPGIGAFLWRCGNGGSATAFAADPAGATGAVTVTVDSVRRATRRVQPGESLRTRMLPSHVHRWRVLQTTEARRTKAIVSIETPRPSTCYAVPSVQSWLRTKPNR